MTTEHPARDLAWPQTSPSLWTGVSVVFSLYLQPANGLLPLEGNP